MTALRALTWVELKLFVREPLTVMFVLVLPVVVLYVLNGVFGSQSDPTVWQGLPPIDFYTSAYVALVAATAGVLSLPVHLAGYREQGVLRRFRASAIPTSALVGAHMMVTVVIATAGAVLLTIVSVLAYDAALPEDWAGVVAAFVLTVVSFAGLGALRRLVSRRLPSAPGPLPGEGPLRQTCLLWTSPASSPSARAATASTTRSRRESWPSSARR